MPDKRVLHIFKYFRPRFTGEGIFLERLAPVFARLRPDVIHDVAVTVTARPQTPVVPCGLGTVHYLQKSDTATGASQAEIVSWLARNGRRYSVVHYHTHVDRTFLASWMLKWLGCRIVLSATLDDSVEGLLKTYRPFFRPLVRRLCAAIDRFVAISPRLFEENNRFVSPEKSVLVPIGISIPQRGDTDRQAARATLQIPAETTILVSVGGICRRKDQMFLVQQIPTLLKICPDLLLILVGPPLEADYCAQIEVFIASHSLQDHVRFAGYADAPWVYYQASDIMVFASHEEGFGTVVIEAMAHGLPVVARRLPGVNDVFVQNGISGYLFDRPDEFLSYTATLLRHVEQRHAMGEAGRAFVIAHFDIAQIAAQYLALYGFAPGGDGA